MDMDHVRVTTERVDRWPYYRAMVEVFDVARWEWVRVCVIRGDGAGKKCEQRAQAIRRLIANLETATSK